jgi:hypothetical protein
MPVLLLAFDRGFDDMRNPGGGHTQVCSQVSSALLPSISFPLSLSVTDLVFFFFFSLPH